MTLDSELGDHNESVALVDEVDLFDDAVCRSHPIHNLWLGYCTQLVQHFHRSPDVVVAPFRWPVPNVDDEDSDPFVDPVEF